MEINAALFFTLIAAVWFSVAKWWESDERLKEIAKLSAEVNKLDAEVYSLRRQLKQAYLELIHSPFKRPKQEPPGDYQFSKEDIKRLITLCHPDKHGGKEMAKEMTQKLIRLRNC